RRRASTRGRANGRGGECGKPAWMTPGGSVVGRRARGPKCNRPDGAGSVRYGAAAAGPSRGADGSAPPDGGRTRKVRAGRPRTRRDSVTMRIGHGYDLHRLEPFPPAGAGRPLVLGGVRLDHDRGPVVHSDGDALLHAATDA